MKGRKKIFNDPVYGFVSVPRGLLLNLVDHPVFQRLRHIGQLGMTPFVYPGALHTRFHHALGALHLMTEALEVLRSKGVEITQKEAESAQIAILLHDIGHGPFSHALEHTLVELHHEELSILFMEKLDDEFSGQLQMAISIFKNRYPKKFLHQLVSSQLDMDRLDYLNRDSFFTGVSEGVIGYDRIIKMLDVADGELVVEEKGIYSIEKFLISRRLMYWQVYLHKTVLSAEQMVIRTLRRARELAISGIDLPATDALRFFLYRKMDGSNLPGILENFARLDDHDLWFSLKNWAEKAPDPTLRFLSKSLVERRLFKLEFSTEEIASDRLAALRLKAAEKLGDSLSLDHLVFTGKESNQAYKSSHEPIKILFKDGRVVPFSEISESSIDSRNVTKHYICYPKI